MNNFYNTIKKSIAAAAIFVMTTSTLFATVPSLGSDEGSNAKTNDGITGMVIGSHIVTTQFSIILASSGTISKEEAIKNVRLLANSLKGTWAERDLNEAASRGDLEAALDAAGLVEVTLTATAEGEFGWAFRTGVAVEKMRIGSRVHAIDLMTWGLENVPGLISEGANYASNEELSCLRAIGKYVGRNNFSDAEFREIHSQAVGFQNLYLSN